jgi:hypothetical protein
MKMRNNRREIGCFLTFLVFVLTYLITFLAALLAVSASLIVHRFILFGVVAVLLTSGMTFFARTIELKCWQETGFHRSRFLVLLSCPVVVFGMVIVVSAVLGYPF